MREDAGRTPAEAAHELDCAPSKITRIELGQSGVSLGDLKLLLQYYGADGEQVEWIVELSRENRKRGRWTGYRSVFAEWFRTFVDLERDAEDIRMVPARCRAAEERFPRLQQPHRRRSASHG